MQGSGVGGGITSALENWGIYVRLVLQIIKCQLQNCVALSSALIVLFGKTHRTTWKSWAKKKK